MCTAVRTDMRRTTTVRGGQREYRLAYSRALVMPSAMPMHVVKVSIRLIVEGPVTNRFIVDGLVMNGYLNSALLNPLVDLDIEWDSAEQAHRPKTTWPKTRS